MRIDGDKLDIFKSMAEQRGITQIEFLEAMIRDQHEGKTVELLMAQLQSAKEEIEEKNSIIIQVEKKYGKHVAINMRRVTFAVTYAQFQYIDDMAHKLKIPKKYLMRDYLLEPEKKLLSLVE